jgi:hypothetical protein
MLASALLLGMQCLPCAHAEPSSAVRYQPLPAEAAEVSRSLLYRYLSNPQAEPGPLLADALRIKLGPFLSASLRRQQAALAGRASTARLRVQLDEQLAISAEVLAFARRVEQIELLTSLRSALQAAGALQLRAPTPGELQAIWPNIGWDLSGGVWVAQAGEQRLLFDLPSAAANDHFVYIETLDAKDSCFRLAELASEVGADCLCVSTRGAKDPEHIDHRGSCPAEAPEAGAPVQRAETPQRT